VKNFEKFDCCGDSDVRPKTHTLDCPNRIDKNIHVTPLQESLQHDENKDCWCEPMLTYKDEFTNVEVWTHKSLKELI
jgi:hypothetical protein